jgi:hypothetical protein
MTSTQSIQSLEHHIKTIKAASFKDYRGTWIETEAEFEEIKSQVLARYDGTEHFHSFCDATGKIFDFVSYDQQAAVGPLVPRSVAPDIDLTPDVIPVAGDVAFPEGECMEIGPPQLSPGTKDQFGNELFCHNANAVACERLSIDDVARHKGLSYYDDDAPHRYATAKFQMKNHGGQSKVKVYSQPVNWDPIAGKGQRFSLSQIWVHVGALPLPNPDLQSVEAGWHKYPFLHHHGSDDPPRLFVMVTVDGYSNYYYNTLPAPKYPKGCFIPIKSHFSVGMPLLLGTWYKIGWYWSDAIPELAGWWLLVNDEHVGYYPRDLFRDRKDPTGVKLSPMGRGVAEWVDWGGETCSDKNTPFPPMGSGVVPNKLDSPIQLDAKGVASHQELDYWGVTSPPKGVWPQLRLERESKNYGAVFRRFKNVNNKWQRALYYGGPGGTDVEGKDRYEWVSNEP